MAKVSVYIEEHLVRRVEIDVPDDLTTDERMLQAEQQVRQQIENEDIILTADDFNGVRLLCVHDEESECETDWMSY